jgi:hypothetical protein
LLNLKTAANTPKTESNKISNKYYNYNNDYLIEMKGKRRKYYWFLLFLAGEYQPTLNVNNYELKSLKTYIVL